MFGEMRYMTHVSECGYFHLRILRIHCDERFVRDVRSFRLCNNLLIKTVMASESFKNVPFIYFSFLQSRNEDLRSVLNANNVIVWNRGLKLCQDMSVVWKTPV